MPTLASWSEVVAFSEPLTEKAGGDAPDGDGSNDEIVAYRVGGLLPVIVWDAEARVRRVASAGDSPTQGTGVVHGRSTRVRKQSTRRSRSARPSMPVAPAAAKALLKTVEGVNWQAAPEPKTTRGRKS